MVIRHDEGSGREVNLQGYEFVVYRLDCLTIVRYKNEVKVKDEDELESHLILDAITHVS
jgi:hypothetical protein